MVIKNFETRFQKEFQKKYLRILEIIIFIFHIKCNIVFTNDELKKNNFRKKQRRKIAQFLLYFFFIKLQQSSLKKSSNKLPLSIFWEILEDIAASLNSRKKERKKSKRKKKQGRKRASPFIFFLTKNRILQSSLKIFK